MRIAFDVKGTLDGPKGELLLEAFKKLQELGHECVVWSSMIAYASDFIENNGLKAEYMQKMAKFEFNNYGIDLFDVAVEDEHGQGKYLGAYEFVYVDELTSNADAIVRYILSKGIV